MRRNQTLVGYKPYEWTPVAPETAEQTEDRRTRQAIAAIKRNPQVRHNGIAYNADEIDGTTVWCSDETGFEVEFHVNELETV